MEPNYYVTAAPKPGGFSRKQLFIGAGLAIAILFGIILTFASGGKNIGNQLQHLSLRLTNFQSILADTETTRNLKNEDLSTLVQELSINLDSDINQLAPLLTSAGLPAKFDKNIVASEADTSTTAKLENAKLNNRLDQGLATVMRTKIASLRALIAETYQLTNNAQLKKSLASTDKHLSDGLKRLDNINLQ